MLREKLKIAKKEEEKKEVNSKKQQAHLIDLEQKVRELLANNNNNNKGESVTDRNLTRIPYFSKEKRKNGSLQKRNVDNKERINSEDNVEEDTEVMHHN